MFYSGEIIKGVDFLEQIKNSCMAINMEIIEFKSYFIDSIEHINVRKDSANNLYYFSKEARVVGMRNILGEVKIWGINELKQEEPIKTSDFNNIKSYRTFKIVGMASKIIFETAIKNYILVVASKGSMNQEKFYLSFELLDMGQNDMVLRFSPLFSYSALINLQSQFGYMANPPLIYLHTSTNNMKYFIDVNLNRITGSVKIHDPYNAYEKNESWQTFYIGLAKTYSPWSTQNPFLIIGSGQDTFKTFSYANDEIINNPYVLVNGSNYEKFSTNANLNNPDYKNFVDTFYIDKDNILAFPITIYQNGDYGSQYKIGGTLFGEPDGLIKIIGANEIRPEDIINIDENNYVVVACGATTDKYSLYAIRKDL